MRAHGQRELRDALEQAQASRQKAAAALEQALAREQELEQQAARAQSELEALVPHAESAHRELAALKREVATLRAQLTPEPAVTVAPAPASRSDHRAMERFTLAALGAAMCLVVAVLAIALPPGESADCSGALGLFCLILAPVEILAEGLRLMVAAVAGMATLVLVGVCIKAALGLSKGAVSSGA